MKIKISPREQDRIDLQHHLDNTTDEVQLGYLHVTNAIVGALDVYLDPSNANHVREARRRAECRKISRGLASQGLIKDIISRQARYIACALRRDASLVGRSGEAVRGKWRRTNVRTMCNQRLCPHCRAGQTRTSLRYAEGRKLAVVTVKEDTRNDHLALARHLDVHERRGDRWLSSPAVVGLAEGGVEVLRMTTEWSFDAKGRVHLHSMLLVSLPRAMNAKRALAPARGEWVRLKGGFVHIGEDKGRAKDYSEKGLGMVLPGKDSPMAGASPEDWIAMVGFVLAQRPLSKKLVKDGKAKKPKTVAKPGIGRRAVFGSAQEYENHCHMKRAPRVVETDTGDVVSLGQDYDVVQPGGFALRLRRGGRVVRVPVSLRARLEVHVPSEAEDVVDDSEGWALSESVWSDQNEAQAAWNAMEPIPAKRASGLRRAAGPWAFLSSVD